MSTERTFAGLAWTKKGKVSRREQFLAEMDRVIPWKQLLAVIAPYYPKAGQGRQGSIPSRVIKLPGICDRELVPL